jgi:hypothetical protein
LHGWEVGDNGEVVMLGRHLDLVGSKDAGDDDLRVEEASASAGPTEGRGRCVGSVGANEQVLRLTPAFPFVTDNMEPHERLYPGNCADRACG